MSVIHNQLRRNVKHPLVLELLNKFNELFPEDKVKISPAWQINYKTLIEKVLIDFLDYDGELTYEAINDFMDEFHKEYIKPEEEPKEEPFYEEHYPTYEDDDINEVDKLNAIIGKAEQIKQQAMKKLKEKHLRLPPSPQFTIPKTPKPDTSKPSKIEDVLLKPIPPKEMKPLKSWAQSQSDLDNFELIEYLKYKARPFQSSREDIIEITKPEDFNKCYAVYKANEESTNYKEDDNDIKNIDGKPVKIYYKNRNMKDMESITNFLEHIFNVEAKPFKLMFSVGGIYETHKRNELVYEYSAPNYNLAKAQRPAIIRTHQDLEIYDAYVNEHFCTLQEHTTTTSNKLCWITSACFTVSRMRKICYCKKEWLPEEIIKSKFIIVDAVEDSLCWYRFVIACIGTKSQKKDTNKRTSAAKRLCAIENGYEYTIKMTPQAKEFLKNYEGTDVDNMKKSAKRNKMNVNFYEYDEEKKYYDIYEQWHFDDSFETYSALMFTHKGYVHIMKITKPDKLTDILICHKCKSFVWRNSSRNLTRFENHVKHCDGKFKKEVILDREPTPYCPHILNNPIYEYCLAHNLQWKPTRFYATYDFETMEQIINENITNTTFLNSQLIPISVASSIKTINGVETKHFDIRQKDFIKEWIRWLFVKAEEIIISNNLNLQSVGLNEEQIKQLDNAHNQATVFGFNSAKFDSNLFKSFMNTDEWESNSGLIGTATSFKQIVMTHKTTKIQLRFIDAQAFTAGGTLKQFGIDFGGESNTQKGIFPYEAINSENYEEVLNQSEPFPYEAFYSYLNQSNPLTPEAYEEYVNDSKQFANRWEYLLNYNDKDVEMMIKPIDELITRNAEYKVDLIRNLSLSKNSSCIKYALAYKDFDPSKDYAVVKTETTFKPSERWWKCKCDNYLKQDMKFNQAHKSNLRDLNKCVSYEDYEWIKSLLTPDSKCHLCGEHFDYENKPTLDRIDNNIGHEPSNLKLACSICNRLRQRNDDKITRLRIQLKKYCILNNLPMTITDKDEYEELRNAITGGLSNVMHRKNIKNETHINKIIYKNGKVYSKDNENVMTHVVGVDFNSLYPSASSSEPHPFNKYHDHIMYMPGRLLNRYVVYDENGNKNEKVFNACRNIINSKSRFKPNPAFIFKATVKLSCPHYLINKFINFPPVFRNIMIKNTPSFIGEYMYKYMKDNNFSSLDKEERKLSMLLDTCDTFQTFNCYYLWFLLDHGLILEDIKSLSTYSPHRGFNSFVKEFMGKRIDILSGKVHGNEKFYKISMNGSYGYDGMNTEKYSKVKFCNKDKTFRAIISDSYMNAREIANDLYLVQQQPKTFHCRTCLQEAFWTLDNAKFWYLTFVYDFMYRCLDMNKMHLIELDSDSCYVAVSGNPNEPNTQVFNYVIKDHKFYNEHIYKWLPDPSKGINDEKKILGLAVEKQGDNCIALSPKCYTIWDNEDNKTISLKLKGVSLKKNKIISQDYYNILENQTIKQGVNINLQNKDGKMSKITIHKNALTGLHTKMIVLPNQCCCPIIHGVDARNYFVL